MPAIMLLILSRGDIRSWRTPGVTSKLRDVLRATMQLLAPDLASQVEFSTIKMSSQLISLIERVNRQLF